MRAMALKLSAYAFSVGFPGRLKSSTTPLTDLQLDKTMLQHALCGIW